MVEDIAEGYRLTSVPHKRPEFYSQSTLAFLRTLPRPGDTVLSSSSFKVRKLSAGKKADEHSTAARHRSSTTAYVDEGGERSGHQPTSKHLSQSSLVSKNKLVSSKSVSSPLSGYSTAQSQSTAESLEAGIRKRFGNHSSLDYPPGAEEAAMELDTVAAVDRDVSGQQYGRRVERPNRRGGYLNKYSKYPPEWLKKDLTRTNLRDFHSLLINQGEKSKKWKVHWFSLNQRDQQLFYFSKPSRQQHHLLPARRRLQVLHGVDREHSPSLQPCPVRPVRPTRCQQRAANKLLHVLPLALAFPLLLFLRFVLLSQHERHPLVANLCRLIPLFPHI